MVEARHGFNKVCICTQTFLSCCISYKFLVYSFSIKQTIITTAAATITITIIKLFSFFYYYVLRPFLSSYLFIMLLSVLQQTIWLFFRDMIKGICLTVILGPPIVSAIIVIVQVRP